MPTTKYVDPTPLAEAAAQGNTAEVLKIIRAAARHKLKFNVNKLSTGYRLTPLTEASINGHTDTMTALIQAGMNVNYVDDNNCTALMHASEVGQLKAVQILLNAGAIVDKTSPSVSQTALMLASSHGSTAVVEALLNAGATIDQQDHSHGWTPLMYASSYGRTAVIEQLLNAGADKSIKDHHGNNALILAASKESPDGALILLKYGANDLDTRNNSGATALSEACHANHYELVESLIDNGAKDVESDRPKHKPLEAAYSYYLSREYDKNRLITLLIKSGADVNITVRDRCNHYQQATPLQISYKAYFDDDRPEYEEKNLKFIKFLIEHGADVSTPIPINAPSYLRERTMLYIAYAKKDLEFVKLLVKQGAAKTPDARRILERELANTDGNQDLAKLLIEYGADINYRDSGSSIFANKKPVFIGALNNPTTTPEIIDLLIKSGSDVNIKLEISTNDKNNPTNTYYKHLLRAIDVVTSGYGGVLRWATGRMADTKTTHTIKELYPEKFNDEIITRLFKETIRDGDIKSIGNMLKVHTQFKNKVIDDDNHTLASYAITYSSPEVANYLRQQGCAERTLTSTLNEYGGFGAVIKDSPPAKKAKIDNYDIERLGSDLAQHAISKSTNEIPITRKKTSEKRGR